MTLERRNPLPEGRYWQDFFGPKIEAATKYFQQHAGSSFVESTEGSDDEAGTWILFKVLEPIPWPAVEFGFPTVAGPEIHHRGDTVQRPPREKDPLDQVDDAIKDAGGSAAVAVKTVALGVGVILGLFLVQKLTQK